jgi:hypothetical protein
MTAQNEAITGQMVIMICERWGALPNVKYLAGAFQMNIKHAPTGNAFTQRNQSLHALLSEYYCWRLAEERLVQGKKKGVQHEAA